MYYQQPQQYGTTGYAQTGATGTQYTAQQPTAATSFAQPTAYAQPTATAYQATATPTYTAGQTFAQPTAGTTAANYSAYYGQTATAQPTATALPIGTTATYTAGATAARPAAVAATPTATTYGAATTLDAQRQQQLLQQQQLQAQQAQLKQQQQYQQQLQLQQQQQLQAAQQQQLQAQQLKQQQALAAQQALFQQQQMQAQKLREQQLAELQKRQTGGIMGTPSSRTATPSRPPLVYNEGLNDALRRGGSSLTGPNALGRDPKRDDRDRRDRDRGSRSSYPPPSSLGSRRRDERRRGRERSPPPKRETSVIPIGDLSEPVRKYKHLKARYPNLYVPTDFAFIENSWVNTIKAIGSSPRPLVITHEAIDFEVTNVKVEEPKPEKKEGEGEAPKEGEEKKEGETTPAVAPAPAAPAAPVPPPVVEGISNSGKRYNVRVALINGVPPEDLVNISLPHLCRQLKFIVQEKKEGSDSSKYLSLIGGSWTKEDGGDPDTELSSLIRTAIRTTKEFLGINLEHVLKWSVLGKVHFVRPQEERHGKVTPKREDVTVILLPHLSHWDPAGMTIEQPTENPPQENDVVDALLAEATADATPAATTEENKDKEEKKDEKKEESKKEIVPGVIHREGEGILVRVVTRSAKLKARFLSLDGLLDYRTTDSMERTFEVSLCAELIKEMLQRDFGETIYGHLQTLPEKKREEKKEKEKEKPSSDKKRERDREEETSTISTKEEKKEDEKKEEEKKEEKKETFQVVIAPVLLSAYRFFDRGDKGYVSAHDMDDILHALGHNLTQKQVRFLTDKVSHAQTSRVYYKDYTHIEVKEGDPRPTPEFMYSSDVILEDEVDANADLAAAQQQHQEVNGTGNFVDVTNLMARLEKSEHARRHAVAEANRAVEELHRIQSQMEDSDRKYHELSNAAHTNNAFLAAKIKEADKFKNLVMVIKAALKRAEEDLAATAALAKIDPEQLAPKAEPAPAPAADVEMTSAEATPKAEPAAEAPAQAAEETPVAEETEANTSTEVKEETPTKEEAPKTKRRRVAKKAT